MTDRKISELTSITGANVDDAADELVIVDTSATETKKITRGELFKDISTDITLGDNGKAIFGAGNDLQLYHNGTNSIVADTGSGSLSLQTNGSSVTLWDTTNAQYMGAFNVGGEVGLYHNGNKKFATTSTGIDVTGSVVSDGLTSQIATTGRSILATFQNSALLAAGNQATIELKNSGQSAFISAESAQVNAGVDLLFSSNNGTGTETNRMRIAENGDISFYEDTGTTPKFYWDASAESLGIGTTSPNYLLHVVKNGATTVRFGESASGDSTTLELGKGFDSTSSIDFVRSGIVDASISVDASENLAIDYNQSNLGSDLRIKSNSSTVASFDSSGNLNVTGTVTADGLTVNKGSDGSDIVSLTGASSGRYLNIQSFENSGAAGAGYDLNATSGQGAIRLSTVNLPRLFVENNGDISFYEDTGTTAQMVWDASADALTFGDNVKATFGAGSDLQIYHDGLNSYVKDAGTGDLKIQGAAVSIETAGGNLYFKGDANVATLYHTNAARLATTSTGIDVTGSVVSDGLTSQIATTGRSILATFQNSALLAAGNQATIELKNSGQSAFISAESAQVNAGVDLLFSSNNGTGTETNRMRIAENGDISFYEDTGTTPKFFWDASAESLGIGTTSPGSKLDVVGTVTADGLTVNKGSDGSDIVSLTGASSGRYLNIQSFSNSGAAGAGYDLNATSGQGAIRLSTVNLPRLFVENNGDISFYEDTGTTAQMVWDASADALTFGDNVKATFGAGSDLEIYHDGSNSYVKDAGDGVLNVQGSSQVNIGGANGTIGVQFVEGANVTLRHNNVAKLATTSTGIDVTGTVTADGLTVADGTSGQINVHSPSYNIQGGTNYGDLRINAPRFRFFEDGTTLRMNIDNGDISFYEDTGTTPKFFWDASAESLGIGTTSPSALLDVTSGVGSTRLTGHQIFLTRNGNNEIYAQGASSVLALGTNSTERMRIDSSGNVGIGTTSPGSKLSVVGLPTSSAGLSAGDIWNDGGTLKIV